MTKDHAFVKEMKEVAEKHGVTCLSMMGKNNDEFFGFVGLCANSHGEFYESVLSVARLYQSARKQLLEREANLRRTT